MSRRRIDPRVEIGSVRLQTAQLDRMLAFYVEVLGFEATHRVGRSLVFLSANRNPTQIVLATAAADAPPTRAQFSIRYPDRAALAEAYRSIADHAIEPKAALDDGVRQSLYFHDPDGNRLELYHERSAEKWPVDADGTLRLQPRALDLGQLRRAQRDESRSDGGSAASSAFVPLSERTRSRLGDVRVRLLNLHKVLLDDARTAYEMDRGRVGSNASLLQLVINDPWFAWLHPLSELVVRIDETLQPDAPATEADGATLLEQVERLLSPSAATEEFAQRYYEALQRQPAVIVAHAEVRRILKQAN